MCGDLVDMLNKLVGKHFSRGGGLICGFLHRKQMA